jgi:hypothetical protein
MEDDADNKFWSDSVTEHLEHMASNDTQLARYHYSDRVTIFISTHPLASKKIEDFIVSKSG